MGNSKYREVRAEMGVVFPMTLKSKMWLTVGTLLISTLAAPAAYIRRDYIRELEGTASLPETLSLLAGVVILVGNLSTFFDGLYMLKYVRERAETSSPGKAEIKKQIRVEDYIMYWQVWGTLVVLLPLVLLMLGGLFPGIIEPMYDTGIAIYQPFDIVTIDIRLVAGISGGGLGLVLLGTWWLVK